MKETVKRPFYEHGLHFSCRRCSDCCRLGPGFVFLSRTDLELLAEGLQIEYTDVMEQYCRWVPGPGREKVLSLREKPGFDCILWKEGCSVYQYRPLQCRTFPFWESTLRTRKTWEDLSCPGIGHGTFHSREYIETCLAQRKEEPILTRGA